MKTHINLIILYNKTLYCCALDYNLTSCTQNKTWRGNGPCITVPRVMHRLYKYAKMLLNPLSVSLNYTKVSGIFQNLNTAYRLIL